MGWRLRRLGIFSGSSRLFGIRCGSVPSPAWKLLEGWSKVGIADVDARLATHHFTVRGHGVIDAAGS